MSATNLQCQITMSMFELLLNLLPTALMLAFVIVLIRKSGALEQKQHRKRVEELLERIAQAVENKR